MTANEKPVEYSEDELNTPPWLNAEFLTKVLKNCEKATEVIVNSFEITPGTAKGDHYASVMFRAVVSYQLAPCEPAQTKSMIIKTMPQAEGQKMELMQESHLFETEIGLYTEVLPKFEQVLRSVGDDTVLKANCLYHSLSPRKLLVLEDVLPLGYAVVRNRAVTLEEAKVVLMKIAKWQAISVKLLQEQPTFFDIYRHNFWTLPNILDFEFITDGIPNFLDLLQTVPELNEFIPHFEAVKDEIFSRSRAAHCEYRTNPQKDTLYVLAHGDFHAKNFMFKHNPVSGALEDILLIDFQGSYVGPIANDLIMGKYMIWTGEMREQHEDELFGYYVEIYNDTLKKIGFAGGELTLVELKAQLRRQKYYELFACSSFLPMWLGIRDGNSDQESLLTSNKERQKLLRNPVYIEELRHILAKFVKMGYFEKK